MSQIHCHNCDWSQDDFWAWKWSLKFWKFRAFGYNPISLIIDDIRTFGYPCYIYLDAGKKHSWGVLLKEIKRHTKRLFTQKWWTCKSWNKDDNKWICPKCKKKSLDID